MAFETFPWKPHLDTEEEQLAYLEAAFEDGDPRLIDAVLGDIAHARGLPAPAPATTDIPSLMRAMKTLGLGLELTAKAA